MARFTIRHPEDATSVARYGWSRGIGWWCEVRQRGRLIEDYDDLDPGGTSLMGVCQVLVRHGLLRHERDLLEAAQLLQMLNAEDIEPEPIRRAAEVLVNLRLAGR